MILSLVCIEHVVYRMLFAWLTQHIYNFIFGFIIIFQLYNGLVTSGRELDHYTLSHLWKEGLSSSKFAGEPVYLQVWLYWIIFGWQNKYSETCLNQTLNESESCVIWTLDKVTIKEIFVNLTCITYLFWTNKLVPRRFDLDRLHCSFVL